MTRSNRCEGSRGYCGQHGVGDGVRIIPGQAIRMRLTSGSLCAGEDERQRRGWRGHKHADHTIPAGRALILSPQCTDLQVTLTTTHRP